MKDSKARSLIKGISWRMIGTIDTFILAYLIFGEVKKALPIALTEIATKIFLYFLHERGWNLIRWGRDQAHIAHLRSLAKGVSWRFFGSIDTIMLSWFFTGNPLGSIAMGGSEVLTKVGLFYVHERIWTMIKWGRIFIIQPKSIEVL